MSHHLISHIAGLALASSEEGSAPEWVQLTPAGPEILARDGRRFKLTDPEILVTAFHENAADLPVDVEHATEVRPQQGLAAPAVGWIKDVEVRSGALWGRVEWTQQGRDWIEAKAYRYLSPAFFHLEDGEMVALRSAGLTNTPAFKMAELASAQPTQETPPMDKSVLTALGLGETASAADAVAAITTLQGNLQTATARAETPDPDRYVSKAQYDATADKLKELTEAREEEAKLALASAVDDGIAAGKITPEGRGDFLAMAQAIGLAAFNKRVEAMPVIATPLGDAPAGDVATASLTAGEISVAAQLGLEPGDLVAAQLKKET